MIGRQADAEHARGSIEQTRTLPLEPAIAGPLGPNPQHNLCAAGQLVQHGVDRRKVVLQVGIEAQGGSTPIRDGLQARENGCLLACVDSQPQPLEPGVIGAALLDQRPGGVGRAIVDQQHETIRADQSSSHQRVQLGGQCIHACRQLIGFVETGHHQPEPQGGRGRGRIWIGQLGCRLVHRAPSMPDLRLLRHP